MIFKDQSIRISKGDVDIVVVILDLVIAAFFYASFVYLRSIERTTRDETEEHIVSATDFSVQLKCLPPHDNLKELKIKAWNFVEEVMAQWDKENG